ncbi:hypothetical protein RFI_30522, partial [Reticulomyxa filosa]
MTTALKSDNDVEVEVRNENHALANNQETAHLTIDTVGNPAEFSDYLCPSIWGIACCFICGIPAFLNVQAATEAYWIGDYNLAKIYSQRARNLILLAVICGLIFALIYLFLLSPFVLTFEKDNTIFFAKPNNFLVEKHTPMNQMKTLQLVANNLVRTKRSLKQQKLFFFSKVGQVFAITSNISVPKRKKKRHKTKKKTKTKLNNMHTKQKNQNQKLHYFQMVYFSHK